MHELQVEPSDFDNRKLKNQIMRELLYLNNYCIFQDSQ